MSASGSRTTSTSARANSATNAQLVEKAAGVVTGMGARIMGPQEVREKLKLVKR